MDPGRKSTEYRRSFDAQDRRRSVELARSTRRYDEHWGAAERADTRLKCSDSIIHHVHSQIVSCWSPVLRDMINLVPTHGLLESTHGLAYVLQVQEDSVTWAAVLDMIYPVGSNLFDWDLWERVLLLADKYNMSGVLQRCVQRLCEPGVAYCLEPTAPNFALRWLGLADKLQLQPLFTHLTSWLQPHLATLACNPISLNNLLAYARDSLSKELVVQLLGLSLQVAAAATAATGTQGQQQQQQQDSRGGNSKSRTNSSRRQRRRTNDWVMGEEAGVGEQDLAHVLGLDMLPSVMQTQSSPSSSDQNQYKEGGYGDSATSSPGTPGSSCCEREVAPMGGPGGSEVQQRLAMCLSSGLFATAAGNMLAPAPPAAAVVPTGPLMHAAPPMVSVAPAVKSQGPSNAVPSFPQQQQLPSIPRLGLSAGGFTIPGLPHRGRPSAAPGLESVMEVDTMEQQQEQQQQPQGSSGWAARLLPGERRRSLAF